MQLFAPFLCSAENPAGHASCALGGFLQGLFSRLFVSLYSACNTAGLLRWRSEDNNKNVFAPWLRAIRARQNLISFVVEMSNG